MTLEFYCLRTSRSASSLNPHPMTRARPNLDVSGCLIDPELCPTDQPMKWATLFGDERPIELEIGSGKGLFLVNAASVRPEHGFVGVELSRKYARLAAERIVKRGVANVRIWPGDAGAVMKRLVADASLRSVHVYFPDPWWKKRHKKAQGFHPVTRCRDRSQSRALWTARGRHRRRGVFRGDPRARRQ